MTKDTASPETKRIDRISLLSQGSRYQLRIALFLVCVIPVLSCGFLALTVLWPDVGYSTFSRGAVIFITLFLGLTGYSLLAKYPRNIERLRAYLKDIAEGDLPERVALPDHEEDLTAIEDYLNSILGDLRAQLKQLQNQLALSRKMQQTIEAQSKELVDAERQRVMIESLGAACHHIGQPATVLRMELDVMRKHAEAADAVRIDRCLEAMERISNVLDKLRRTGEYRTVPYQTFAPAGNGEQGALPSIIDINQHTDTPPEPVSPS